MLRVEDISVAYGTVPVLDGLRFEARPGEILCLLGRNGAGKTTTCKAIMGLLPLRAGRITWNGTSLGDLAPHDVPRQGIGYVPQGRRLFGELSVAENLAVGLGTRNSPRAALDRALDLFPALTSRLKQRAETLSGGEQTMLTVARALCVEPDLMLLDEPTEGLQPSMVAAIQDVVLALKAEGKAICSSSRRSTPSSPWRTAWRSSTAAGSWRRRASPPCGRTPRSCGHGWGSRRRCGAWRRGSPHRSTTDDGVKPQPTEERGPSAPTATRLRPSPRRASARRRAAGAAPSRSRRPPP